MRKRHLPGKNKKTLCGHETTEQEYQFMMKGCIVNCVRCLNLINIKSEKNKSNLNKIKPQTG